MTYSMSTGTYNIWTQLVNMLWLQNGEHRGRWVRRCRAADGDVKQLPPPKWTTNSWTDMTPVTGVRPPLVNRRHQRRSLSVVRSVRRACLPLSPTVSPPLSPRSPQTVTSFPVTVPTPGINTTTTADITRYSTPHNVANKLFAGTEWLRLARLGLVFLCVHGYTCTCTPGSWQITLCNDSATGICTKATI